MVENYGPHSYGAVPMNFKPSKDAQNMTFLGSAHTLGPSPYPSQTYPAHAHQSQPFIRGRNFYPQPRTMETTNHPHARTPAPAYFPNVHPGYGKVEVQQNLQLQQPPLRNAFLGNVDRNHHTRFFPTNLPSQSHMCVPMAQKLAESPIPPSRQVNPTTMHGGAVMWPSSSGNKPPPPSNSSMLHTSVYPTHSMAPPLVSQKRKYPVSDGRFTIPISDTIPSHTDSWTTREHLTMTMIPMNSRSDGDCMKRPKLNGSSYMEMKVSNSMGLPSMDTASSSVEDKLYSTYSKREEIERSAIPGSSNLDPCLLAKEGVLSRNQDELSHTVDSSSRHEIEVIAANILCSLSKKHDCTFTLEEVQEDEEKSALVSPDASTDDQEKDG